LIMIASLNLVLIIDREIEGEGRYRLGPAAIPPWILPLLLGALLGMGALGRPNLFFLLIPALPVWLFFRFRKRGPGIGRALLCLAAIISILLLPLLYNFSQSGRWAPASSHAGINFYMGNCPGASGVFNPPPGMRSDMKGLIEDSRKEAERRVGRPLSAAEASSFWLDQSRNWIGSDPRGWLRLLGAKFVLFWNGVDVCDILDLKFFQERFPVLKLMFIPYALISPLAFTGIFILWLLRRRRAVMLIYTGAALGSIVLFFLNTRYRLPSVPVLILLAALFLVWLFRRLREGKWKPVVPALSLAVAVFFLLAGREIIGVNLSATYTFLGNHYLLRNDEVKGEEAFARAYQLDPDDEKTMINYGRILLRRRKAERAGELYAAAFAKNPRYPRLAIEYGSLLEQLGRKEEARQKYLFALEFMGTRDKLNACQLLSRTAYDERKLGEAIAWIKKGLEIAPRDKKLLELLRWLEEKEEQP
ncbi:MAG: hypothetical protein JXB45_03270, partial [Candidatus Krumholzibacteriota bacterium]|nr:hypothetical protein [Candidatus Krumholzibacteriota bacterium]